MFKQTKTTVNALKFSRLIDLEPCFYGTTTRRPSLKKKRVRVNIKKKERESKFFVHTIKRLK